MNPGELGRRGKPWFRLAAQPAVEWALLAAALLPFVLISAYNHPTDDDFQGAVFARHLGFWAGIGEYYQHWTGRYTSSFFYGLAYEAPSLGAWLVALRLAPVLLLGALLTATQFALGGLFPPLSSATRWRAAGYGVLLYLCGIPSVASALYWLSGSAVYTTGIILTLGLLGVAARLQRGLARPGWVVLGGITAFLLAGTNELSMLLTVVALVGWCCCQPRGRRRWPVLLLGAGLGAAVTLMAPGNVARAAVVSTSALLSSHLLVVGAKSVYLTVAHWASWGSSGLLLLMTLLVALSAEWSAAPRASPAYRWWLAAGSGVGVLLVLPLPTLWLTNEVPARVWNLIYFVFLAGWFAVVFRVFRQVPPAGWKLTKAQGSICRSIWLLLVLLSQSSAVHRAYVDLAFKAPGYNLAQHRRYQLLERAQQRRERQVVVPPLLAQEYQYPATIFLHELELSPRDIANSGLADYFGLDSVRVSALPQRVQRHFEQ
ncbi:DUF6056 family protein [Hymenobacter persicinus]|uniref:Glycosyltransferase RgtA/B/C/D-like domain-containing protein n=1 Tax=Hymenobacter persicinus TaxID=2025506 RepID=A0A4Q5L7D0_9BACT|nr:DUF6056 family protein [Hymenobacter persicinus]RYU76068.1 hypothetical protein EWM57_19180 [Hymenobacter persicinus]